MATNQKTHNDEIDLIELFHKLGQKTIGLFRWLTRSMLLIIVFFIRNFYIIIGFIIIGGFIGYGMFKLSKEYYSSDMVIRTNTLPPADFIAYVNTIHELTKDAASAKDFSTLSRTLQIDDTVTRKIKDIQAYYIIDMRKRNGGYLVDYGRKFDLQKDTLSRLSNRVEVRVEVYNNEIFEYVKKGLYNYFNSNSYINQLNNNRMTQLRELISKTRAQINKLDSLEDVQYFQKNIMPQYKSGQIVFLNQPEVKLLHPDLIDLFKQKQSYQKELEIYKDPITIIEDFTPLSKVENSRSKYVIIWGFVFGVIGILVMFYWEQRKSIKDLINKG